MSMLKKIIKALNKNIEVDQWSVTEVCAKTYEQFFVLQKLETARKTQTTEQHVTLYKEYAVGDKKLLGSASFIVSHELSGKELNNKIEEALYAAQFAKNPFFNLVEGTSKKSYKEKNKPNNPSELLQEIAQTFISSSDETSKFNSLEVFYNEKEIHLVNSNGVNYKKDIYEINVEAIPSYTDEEIKTELYRMFKYRSVDMKKIKEDSLNAINDVKLRAKASKNDKHQKINVILKDDNVKAMFGELIYSNTYDSVYRKSNYKSIGESLQDNPINPLNVSLIPATKADYFDSDGVLLKETAIIKNGVINDYFGSSRFASYLNMKPNGILNKIKVSKGSKSLDKMKKQPYIEIIDLSGIQLDLFAGYIGGEVRLANYFDGKDTYPISGFSFSGNLVECVNTLELSKETTDIEGYVGPKYALLKDFEII